MKNPKDTLRFSDGFDNRNYSTCLINLNADMLVCTKCTYNEAEKSYNLNIVKDKIAHPRTCGSLTSVLLFLKVLKVLYDSMQKPQK